MKKTIVKKFINDCKRKNISTYECLDAILRNKFKRKNIQNN